MDEKKDAVLMTRRYKYVISFAIYFCYFVYALNMSITGPSLLDLRKIYKTSFSVISNVNTIRFFAFGFGSINGFVFQHISRQLGYMFLLLTLSITTAVTPFLPSVNLLFLNFAINGFACGGIASLSDIWIIEIWQQECPPFEQALHFTFGFGTIITSLLVESFLTEKHSDYISIKLENIVGIDIEINGNQTMETESNSNELIAYKKAIIGEQIFYSRVYIPYSFVAIAIALSSFFFGCLYCYKKYIPPETRVIQTHKEEFTAIKRLQNFFKNNLMPAKSLLVVFSALLYSMLGTLQWSQFNYFSAFAHFSDLHISEKRAAIMLTVLSIALAFGRLIAIPVSHYIRPKHMIFGNIILLFIANFLLLFLANKSEAIMFISNIFYGLGLSTINASIYSMLEEHTHVNNLIGSLFIFMIGMSNAISPIFLGIYVQTEPLTLIYLNSILTFVSLLFIFSIQILTFNCMK